MTISTKEHLKALLAAIHALEPTGADGFEGFIGSILGVICEQPFRLASSGAQRGRDGDSAYDRGATYFEGKRYDADVPKKEITGKFTDLRADNQGQVDTWVMGATASVPALRDEDVRAMAETVGIGIVILDWSEITPLPPLATASAMSDGAAEAFLSAHLTDLAKAALVAPAVAAMAHLRTLSDFDAHSKMLKSELKNPSIGLGLAKAANRTWLNERFGDAALARQQFGQPIAPNDAAMDFRQPRTALSGELLAAFSGKPKGNVYSVIGPEGAGKSWLVVTTWLRSDPAGILLFIPATDLRDPEDVTGFEELLISALIAQTGDRPSEANRLRWLRRFDAWRANPDPENIRLTLCIDGLNQNRRFPWIRLIEGASKVLKGLGGQLVLTTRRPHYPAIRNATYLPQIRVQVPEWSDTELDTILRLRDVDPDVLTPEVRAVLKNPRILGIAVNLLDAKSIESIHELSVERLLFEHVLSSERTGANRIAPSDFSKELAELGGKYLARLEEGESDDLTLFDARSNERLQEVSTSRFFQSVSNDPDRYEIAPDGLRLALALWLVTKLEKEERNHRDPFSRLEAVLEPVSALDLTAEIVGSAAEVACLQEDCPIGVVAALIRYYVGLQNLPDEKREAFVALVNRNPEAFTRAAKDAALAPSASSETDWLTAALIHGQGTEVVKETLAHELPDWLSYFSLAPSRMAFRRSADPGEAETERQKIVDRLEKKLSGLTPEEQELLSGTLKRADESDVDALHELAFSLMSGMALAPFAKALVGWAFANALHSSINGPDKAFQNLIRFNPVDWAATRASMLEYLHTSQGKRSSVGDWAAVTVLNATGDPADAVSAASLIEVLRPGSTSSRGWRRAEQYSETDPCDPSAGEAANVEATVAEYAVIPVDRLRVDMNATVESHFFDNALPAIARFRPNTGEDLIDRFAADVLGRDGLPLRQGVLTLLQHSVLLEREVVDALVSIAQESSGKDPDDTNRREWLIGQYALFIALPHLTGNEQMRAIDGMRASTLMLNLMETLRPADADTIEALLESAVEAGDDDRLVRLLAAIHYSGSALSPRITEMVAALMRSFNDGVRAQALSVAASCENADLAMYLAESGWDAGAVDAERNSFEAWYGSSTLINAAEQEPSLAGNVLDRVSLSHYGFAAARLGANVASAVAHRIDAALRRVLDLPEMAGLPAIERLGPPGAEARPPLVDVREENTPSDPKSMFDRLGETDEEFQERQDRLHDAYDRFGRELTNADAKLVLTDIGEAGMAAVVAARPDLVVPWHDLLMAEETSQMRNLPHFAFRFARAIAVSNPELAVTIHNRYSGIDPTVSYVVGLAKVPIGADACWSSADVRQMAETCYRRLDNCNSDRAISLEVVAALSNGRGDLVDAYIQAKLDTNEPAEVARGLTVAGFADASTVATEALERFADTKGFLGEVTSAAKSAHERNVWSRHWYSAMATASTPLDFWRFSVLLAKIVDARLEVWGHEIPIGTTFEPFYATVEEQLKQRIKKWSEKRKRTLFGRDVPDGVFLSARKRMMSA